MVSVSNHRSMMLLRLSIAVLFISFVVNVEGQSASALSVSSRGRNPQGSHAREDGDGFYTVDDLVHDLLQQQRLSKTGRVSNSNHYHRHRHLSQRELTEDASDDPKAFSKFTNTGNGVVEIKTIMTHTGMDGSELSDFAEKNAKASGRSMGIALVNFLNDYSNLFLDNVVDEDPPDEVDQLNVIRSTTNHVTDGSPATFVRTESEDLGCRCQFPGEELLGPVSDAVVPLDSLLPADSTPEVDESEQIDEHEQQDFSELRWGGRNLVIDPDSESRGELPDGSNELVLDTSDFVVKGGFRVIRSDHVACKDVDFICPDQEMLFPEWSFTCTTDGGDSRFGNRRLSLLTGSTKRDGGLKRSVKLPSSYIQCGGGGSATAVQSPDPVASDPLPPPNDEDEEVETQATTNIIPEFFTANFFDFTDPPSKLPSMRPSVSAVPSEQPSGTPGAATTSTVVTTTTLVQAPANTRLISGTVFEDTDNSGLGDTPLPGVTVAIYENFIFVRSTMTDAAGAFSFDVDPGPYAVVQSNLPGYVDVSSTGETPNIIMVDATTSDVTGLSFVDELTSAAPSSSPSAFPSLSSSPSGTPSVVGSRLPSIMASGSPSFSGRGVSGNVFEDTDNDSIADEPVAGVIVGLFSAPNDGQKLLATTLTDESGAFSFIASPGHYIVVQQNKPGMIDITDSDGGNPNLISVDLVANERITGLFFLDELPSVVPSASVVPTGTPSSEPSVSVEPSLQPSGAPSFADRTIAGHVLEDIDNDDLGDEPLEGVQVSLLNEETSQIVQTTLTDSAGAFSFSVMVPGKYIVFEINPSGYIDVADSDGGIPNSIRVDLTENVSIKGLYFVDELPSNAPSTSQVPSVSPSLVPSVSPFPSLSPSSAPSVSSIPTTVPTNAPSVSQAPSFVPSLGPSFADRAIVGKVLEDIDNDDIGEDPIPGVTITLFNADFEQVGVTTTDETGAFSFSVPPGKYFVIETNLEGYLDVADSDGGNKNAIEVDLSLTAPTKVVNNLFFVDELPSSAPSESKVPSSSPSKFPTVSPAPSLAPSIGPTLSTMPSDQPSLKPSFEDRAVVGRVLEDIDNDGDGDEPIPGVVIGIYDVNFVVVATTVTDEAGRFSFSVPPGKYTVVESNPPGFVDVTDSDGGIPNAISVDLSVSTNKNVADGLFFVDERPSNAPSDSKMPSSSPSTRPSVSAVPSRSPSIAPSVSSQPSLKPSVTPTDSVMPTDIPSLTPSFADRAIVGKVLEDVDNDDTGDEPIPGVTIILYNENFIPVATTTTDQSGTFFFEVPPGKYVVVELNPDGFLDVNDSDGGLPNVISVDSTVSKIVEGLFFVDERPSNAPSLSQVPTSTPSSMPSVSSKPSLMPSVGPTLSVMPSFVPSMTPSLFPRLIAGKVLEDIDNDDVGEDPIEGVVISIYNEEFVLVGTTLTDESGTFQFVLPPGKYTVIEQNAEGFLDVNDSDGGLPNSIAVDTTVTKVIDDLFFVDERPSNAPSLSVMPSSLPSAEPSISSRPSSLPSISPSISVMPSSEPSLQPSLFPRLIAGKVLEDIDNDDVGEDPIPGVLIFLYTADLQPVATTLTDESGAFSFVAPPGEYFVVELNKEGFLDVIDSDGGSPNSIKVDTTSTFVVDDLIFVDELPSSAPSESAMPSMQPSAKPSVSSEPSLLPSAGPSLSVMPSFEPSMTPSVFPRFISGVVLEDIDNDDDGDEPMSNVLIGLYDSSFNLVATTLTNEAGRFDFVVQPGKYTVIESTPEGFFDVIDSDGGNPNSIAVDVTVTKVVDDLFFVNERPSNTPSMSAQPSDAPSLTPSLAPRLISGKVLEDIDNDDDGDDPMPQVLISLYDENFNLVATTLTDESGGFFFWVRPGRYTVLEQTPPGFLDVSDSDNGNPNIISVDVTNGVFEVTDLVFVNERPSNAPSLSSAPSSEPSHKPSVSVEPSSKPSSKPSGSVFPSYVPTSTPSISVEPSLTPSATPSLSSEPSAKPSSQPSGSVFPSYLPTSKPSLSVEPSLTPSATPSLSSEPSAKPSSQPSGSVFPSYLPTSKPSLSVEPSLTPSYSPSLSSEPSAKPSSQPSGSVFPSYLPTSKPSGSFVPSYVPTSTPSLSAMPSLEPTSKPSGSFVPSLVPTSTPSVSVEPSLTPSATPSLSSAPSSKPSSQPSGSVFPSDVPSSKPSVSVVPSSQPSSTPSVSVEPSLTPSYSPSVSVVPSSEPTFVPSVSAAPSAMPSVSPSISVAPSSEPSSLPSGSSFPSSSPSVSPSISVAPSSEPSSLPSGSSFPSQSPSSHPSISSAPSSSPSSVPSGSFYPSESPSEKPVRVAYDPTPAPTYAEGLGRSASAGGYQQSESSSSRSCAAEETTFDDAECSGGLFGSENVDFTPAADGNTVTFFLKKPPVEGLSKISLWFKNPISGYGEDFCWFPNSVSTGPFGQSFTAKCVHGWATVSITGGDGLEHFGAEVYVPHADCQQREVYEEDFQDYNPAKRCFWELKLPCACGATRTRSLRTGGN